MLENESLAMAARRYVESKGIQQEVSKVSTILSPVAAGTGFISFEMERSLKSLEYLYELVSEAAARSSIWFRTISSHTTPFLILSNLELNRSDTSKTHPPTTNGINGRSK